MIKLDKEVEILDCTLRDGGYYTNWDFEQSLVDSYLKSMDSLPVDFLEVGYRSPKKVEYLGKYFYCPIYILEQLKEQSGKKLAIILNEKDVRPEDVEALLGECTTLLDLIRIAVNPANFDRALILAKSIKDLGFSVAFNVMYMSTWAEIEGFFSQLEQANGLVDYFYLVDSYGGVFPDEVAATVKQVKERLDCKIGFHGHNNLELGLINTLTAIESGIDIVDATITGMGRGAGNLKTELLLTTLNARHDLKVDFNALGSIVSDFETLQQEHGWGTNVPYMVSGANSLPQKDVMEWVSKRFYSMNSIVQALHNQSAGVEDNIKFNTYLPEHQSDTVLIIGGGPSVRHHNAALVKWIENQSNLSLIHASAKNSAFFKDLDINQIFCLVGNEGHRLEANAKEGFDFVTECILPPFPRKMGTYVPEHLTEKSYELKEIAFTDKVKDSHTVLALQTALELGAKHVLVVGYDGYAGDAIRQIEIELAAENDQLFRDFANVGISVVSLTPTRYASLRERSVYDSI